MTLWYSLLAVVGVYLLIGGVFAWWFVTRGVGRCDDAARTGTPMFRVLIFPGSVALWPCLWRKARSAPREVSG